MSAIFAVILAKNEARHIGACIDSVQWADAVMLSDSHSDDDTADIAAAKGAHVRQHRFVNFSVNRNLALTDAGNAGAEWVFFIDADERATPELAAEIKAVVRQEMAGWWVPRYNVMWGHTIKGGGWYPDRQLRLLKVGRAAYDPSREVHEIVRLDGPAGVLREHLIHYNYDSPAHFHAKQQRYIQFEARILHNRGIRAKPWTYLSMPLREFYRRYIRLRGYRDGWMGLHLCGLMAWYTYKTYLSLRRLYSEEETR
ncbi:MAG: glycosyltransferase family 2 protein [Anaerolineae bacterium]